MQTSVLSTLLLAACVRGIEITSPTKNDVVDLAAGVKVTWSTVASDPKTAHLFLVNMAGGHTPYSKDLGEVDLSKGSITVTESVKDDTTYQFNFQSMKENSMGILAQSEQFEAKADEGEKETTTKSTAATTTKATVAGGASETAEATTLSSVVVLASGSSTSGAASKTASSTSTSTTANASSTPESGAAGCKVGGVLALVAGIVAVVA
ncbi:hypothetical protein B0T14DRAFT_426524 [Immersiella caudata]|uniref:Yeast cell wall synthesis Kre9/Knh1-like N-terminal domain-containing protein n=1 Tax=Immersiella caudata TaxID=314043 RepID=A0AA39WY25_9PEZI|nr:hypothetical protein B0T14DRAFT_426524 [Immersiella caudata]